jgi:hypothetical protein
LVCFAGIAVSPFRKDPVDMIRRFRIVTE